jgi:hypothetical protein
MLVTPRARRPEHLELLWGAKPYGELNPEDHYDVQVIRPTIHMLGGV